MLTQERKGEIALKLLRYRIKNEGFHLFPNKLERELGNLSKSMGVPKDDIREFLKEEIGLLMKEAFDHNVVINKSCGKKHPDGRKYRVDKNGVKHWVE